MVPAAPTAPLRSRLLRRLSYWVVDARPDLGGWMIRTGRRINDTREALEDRLDRLADRYDHPDS